MRTGTLLVMAALCFVACARQSNNPPPKPLAANTDAAALIDYYVLQKTGVSADKVDAAVKAPLLRELEQLQAAALVEQTRADPNVRVAIELQRIELLAHAGAVAAGVFAAPSDAELKTQYELFVASLPSQEFHVAHILVATEAGAQILITKLQGSSDFAALAHEQSADDSKVRGGDLGWITPGKLPSEFTNAVLVLKPNQFTARPVHTIYGWHIIKLLGTRAVTHPSIEQVQAQLAANWQQARFSEFLQSALANTKTAKSN